MCGVSVNQFLQSSLKYLNMLQREARAVVKALGALSWPWLQWTLVLVSFWRPFGSKGLWEALALVDCDWSWINMPLAHLVDPFKQVIPRLFVYDVIMLQEKQSLGEQPTGQWWGDQWKWRGDGRSCGRRDRGYQYLNGGGQCFPFVTDYILMRSKKRVKWFCSGGKCDQGRMRKS